MQPRIVKGKAKPEVTTTSFLTTVGSTAGNAAYSAFTYLSGATPSATVEEKKDLVTFTKFAELELVEGQEPVHCLMIGYQSGFQIWDLSQSEKYLAANTKTLDLKVTELMYVSLARCCCYCFLFFFFYSILLTVLVSLWFSLTLRSEQNYHIRDLCVFNRIKSKPSLHRPLIGIVSENKAQSSNTKILLYSILANEMRKSIEFLNPIVRVIGNEKAICVVCFFLMLRVIPVIFLFYFFIFFMSLPSVFLLSSIVFFLHFT
jgi:hypothetical protein